MSYKLRVLMKNALKSMTGFGRGEIATPLGRLVLEVSSINRKYLEMSIQLPKELFSFEPEIRGWISKSIHRGQLSLRYTLYAELKGRDILPDRSFMKQLKTGWEKIAHELGFPKEEVNLLFLSQQMQKLSLPVELEDLPKYQKLLAACTEKALGSLVKMKAQEGAALGKDIQMRLKGIEKELSSIQKKAPEALVRMKAKMQEKIGELFAKEPDNQDRILREVMIYSEKTDVTEEIVRLKSHLKQFFSLLTSPEEAAGRKMDFLIQEMMREINTIGSKCSDAGVALHVVESKAALEKIREQVQNIE